MVVSDAAGYRKDPDQADRFLRVPETADKRDFRMDDIRGRYLPGTSHALGCAS